jgi:hypothetical protein
VLSWIQSTESRELYIRGLKQIRSGVLIILVASIISLVAAGLLFLLLVALVTPVQWRVVTEVTPGRVVPISGGNTVTPRIHIYRVEDSLREFFNNILKSPNVLTLVAATVITLLVSLILSLIGYWARLVPGARRLGRASREFTTASTLIWIGYFWGYLTLLLVILIGLGVLAYTIVTESTIGILTAIIGISVGFIVAVILVIIGHIGLIVLAYKLYEFEKITLYLIIAILLIVVLISTLTGFIPYVGPFMLIGTSILSFITWILLYIALGESIKRAESQQVPPTPPATS